MGRSEGRQSPGLNEDRICRQGRLLSALPTTDRGDLLLLGPQREPGPCLPSSPLTSGELEITEGWRSRPLSSWNPILVAMNTNRKFSRGALFLSLAVGLHAIIPRRRGKGRGAVTFLAENCDVLLPQLTCYTRGNAHRVDPAAGPPRAGKGTQCRLPNVRSGRGIRALEQAARSFFDVCRLRWEY